ncbi:MAG: hypothetical protein EPO23_06015 [Xanthobacteraceae bacterium]|nr:MAG: hypothetical protein EPO23_06015 [Xanthobacteraceae bacterium]
MLKSVIAGAAALTLLGSAAVYAQPWLQRVDYMDRGDHMRMGPGMGRGMGSGRMSAEDFAAFTDARLAAVKAGLKLNAEQDKLWPPIEAAVRDFAKQRALRANAMREQTGTDDPIARLRLRAEAMTETATGLKRIADAADPLYKTLDDGQKRRLTALTRMGHDGRWGHGRMHWRDRDRDRDDDRGGPRPGSDRL